MTGLSLMLLDQRLSLSKAGLFSDIAATAADPALASNSNLISGVAGSTGLDVATVADLVKKWQSGTLDALAFDSKARLQGISPVWRCCAGCGRRLFPPPGQPWCIGPYIEGYEGVEL